MTGWADRAVVLRVGHFREADLWLKILCHDHGLLTVFAFGACHSRRRFCGCLDVFNSLNCRVKFSGRARFANLEEAVLLEGPGALRQDWRRMGLATNCLRFVEALGVNDESAGEAFALMEDLRHTLDTAEALPPLLPLFFRLRFAGVVGCAPNLHMCGLCGAPLSAVSSGPLLFAASEGHVRCGHCGRSEPARYTMPLSPAGLDLLRHVQQEFPSGWRTVSLPAAEQRACARAIDSFIQYHLGLAWENGSFRHV